MVYLGLENLAESATITSAELSNTAYLKDRLTSLVAASSLVSSVTITAHWNGAEKKLSSFVLHEHNGRDAAATGAVWRVWLYDHWNPLLGNVVADSGTLPVLAPYTAISSLDVWDEAHSVFTFEEVQLGRRVPHAIAAKSAQIVISSPAFTWRLGYLWGGLSHALSSAAVLGAEAGRSVVDSSRPPQTFAAGVAFEPATRPLETVRSFPKLGACDRATLASLDAAAGTSSPWFLHVPSANVAPQDRDAEGGVVRLTDPLSFTRVGSLVGPNALYKTTFNTTRWR